MVNNKIICGPCGEVFEDNQAYLDHVCEKTGYKPTQIEQQDALSGGRFSLQSKAALARGAKRKEAKEAIKKE